jgi:hypothetical protein
MLDSVLGSVEGLELDGILIGAATSGLGTGGVIDCMFDSVLEDVEGLDVGWLADSLLDVAVVLDVLVACFATGWLLDAVVTGGGIAPFGIELISQ